MNPFKEAFARSTEFRTLAQALDGADAVVGLSAKGAFSAAMIGKMARDPIVFAMANPDPEVLPEEVLRVRKDAIMATGRSDYPNQVNNVLCFPFIFRGALDVRATTINEEMKLAAVRALADLAKQEVPENVVRAYGGQRFHFGRDYLLPKPFDQRALLWVAPAVAEAAMKSGVAGLKLDLERYRESLEGLLGASYTFMRSVKNRIRNTSGDPTLCRVVFPEGENATILRAAQILRDEKIAEPILLGNEVRIRELLRELDCGVTLNDVQIIEPSQSERVGAYAGHLEKRRDRKGMTLHEAKTLMRTPNYFGPSMVEMGDADAVLNGVSQSYSDTLRPAIQAIGVHVGSRLVGLHLVLLKKRILWIADTTVNIDPSAEELSDIAIQTAQFASRFMADIPRIAMLSFSNFGSNEHPNAKKVRRATELIRDARPDLIVDGEMQADTALSPEVSSNSFPFNRVPGDANILIFPDLQSANIAYKLIGKLAEAEMIGPILLGMEKPAYILAQNSSVTEVVNMATLAVMEIRARS
jgi:malate dehydrogenase (oxaloacetate-decarboxylating)(NADP+)